jgi:hypothetical protein
MSAKGTSLNPVIRLARRIARRADQIAQREAQLAHDIEAWLRAEEEILGIRLPQPNLRPAAARRAASDQVATLSHR